MKTHKEKLLLKIRAWVLFFIVAIVVSGATAFAVESGLKFLTGFSHLLPVYMTDWLNAIYTGVVEMNQKYPFIFYGTDWLAFAHIVIAVAFIGVYRNPVKNIWIIEWGIISCLLVFPLALIFGPIRGIPFFHRVIDCSFGAFGIIPLLIVRKNIIRLAALC